MNEWMNGMSEWMNNEWMEKLMNDKMNDKMNRQMNEPMNEATNERSKDWREGGKEGRKEGATSHAQNIVSYPEGLLKVCSAVHPSCNYFGTTLDQGVRTLHNLPAWCSRPCPREVTTWGMGTESECESLKNNKMSTWRNQYMKWKRNCINMACGEFNMRKQHRLWKN